MCALFTGLILRSAIFCDPERGLIYKPKTLLNALFSLRAGFLTYPPLVVHLGNRRPSTLAHQVGALVKVSLIPQRKIAQKLCARVKDVSLFTNHCDPAAVGSVGLPTG